MPAVATACAAIFVAMAAGAVSERPSTSPGFGDAVIVAVLLYSGVVRALLTVVVATVAAVLACCGWAWYAAHRLDIGDRMFPGSS